MSAEDGIALLNYAFDAEQEDKLFNRWIQFAQNTMSFEEFKQALKPAVIPDEKAILADVESIINSTVKEG